MRLILLVACVGCSQSVSRVPAPYCQSVAVSTLTGGAQGEVDGPAGVAQFMDVTGIAVDPAGSLVVADDCSVRRVSFDGTTTTLAGVASACGYADGVGTNARFDTIFNGVAVGGDGIVYVADDGNGRIRKITPDGTTTTLAGNATFTSPHDVAVDATATVYVTEAEPHVRRISPDGTVATLAEGRVVAPWGMTIDAAGNLDIADDGAALIRRLAVDGTIATIPTNALFSGGEPIGLELFMHPFALALGPSGELFVADAADRIVRIGSDGAVAIVAGADTPGDADGNGCEARFELAGIAYANGRLYVAEARRIRVVTLP